MEPRAHACLANTLPTESHVHPSLDTHTDTHTHTPQYTYILTHTYTHKYTHTYTHTDIYTHESTHTYIHTHTCTHTYKHRPAFCSDNSHFTVWSLLVTEIMVSFFLFFLFFLTLTICITFSVPDQFTPYFTSRHDILRQSLLKATFGGHVGARGLPPICLWFLVPFPCLWGPCSPQPPPPHAWNHHCGFSFSSFCSEVGMLRASTSPSTHPISTSGSPQYPQAKHPEPHLSWTPGCQHDHVPFSKAAPEQIYPRGEPCYAFMSSIH